MKCESNESCFPIFPLGPEVFRSFFSRVVQFWDPKKEDLFTKSRESWVTLLDQIRQLLLESIKKHLIKCEKRVQLYREKYSDPNWSFLKYLRLHVRNETQIMFFNVYQIGYFTNFQINKLLYY